MKSNEKWQIDNIEHLWAPFEYFQVRFVWQLIPVMVTLIPDRVQCLLSISLLTFFLPLSLVALKRRILQKKHKTSTNYGKSTSWLAHLSIPILPALVAGQTSSALSTSLINSSSSLLLLRQNPPNNNHKLQNTSNRYAQLSIHSWLLLISHWDWQTLSSISNDWLRIVIDTN